MCKYAWIYINEMRSDKSNSFCNAPLSAKAMSLEALSVSRSISLGMTTSCLPCGISIFCVFRLQSLPRMSTASVCASTTVGTPIAITGTPIVSFVILVRWLPTPHRVRFPCRLSEVYSRAFRFCVRRVRQLQQRLSVLSAVQCWECIRLFQCPSVPWLPSALRQRGEVGQVPLNGQFLRLCDGWQALVGLFSVRVSREWFPCCRVLQQAQVRLRATAVWFHCRRFQAVCRFR